MSRGLGGVERGALDLLATERSEVRPDVWFSIRDLAAAIFTGQTVAGSPSRSQIVSARRAAHSLREKGYVDVGHYGELAGVHNPYFLTYAGAGLRDFLAVRLVLTDDEAAEARLLNDEYRRHMDAHLKTFDTNEWIQEKRWIDWYERAKPSWAISDRAVLKWPH